MGTRGLGTRSPARRRRERGPPSAPGARSSILDTQVSAPRCRELGANFPGDSANVELREKPLLGVAVGRATLSRAPGHPSSLRPPAPRPGCPRVAERQGRPPQKRAERGRQPPRAPGKPRAPGREARSCAGTRVVSAGRGRGRVGRGEAHPLPKAEAGDRALAVPFGGCKGKRGANASALPSAFLPVSLGETRLRGADGEGGEFWFLSTLRLWGPLSPLPVRAFPLLKPCGLYSCQRFAGIKEPDSFGRCCTLPAGL